MLILSRRPKSAGLSQRCRGCRMRLYDRHAPNQATARSASRPHHHPLVIVLAAAAAGIVGDRFRPLPLWAWWTMAAGRSGSLGHALVDGGGCCSEQCRAAVGRGRHGGGVAPLPLVSVRPPTTWAATPAARPSRCASRPWPCECPRRARPAADPMRICRRSEACAARRRAWPHSRRGRSGVPPRAGPTLLVQGPPPRDRAPATGCDVSPTLRARRRRKIPGRFDCAAYLRAERRTQPAEGRVAGVRVGGPVRRLAQLSRPARSGARPRQSAAGTTPGPALRRNGRGRPAGPAGTSGLRPHRKLHGHRHDPSVGRLPDCTWASWPGAMFWLVRRTPLCRAAGRSLLVAAATVFYMFLVDAGPPVVRATVLVLVACAAALGRRALSFNSLAAAALVVSGDQSEPPLPRRGATLVSLGGRADVVRPRWMAAAGSRSDRRGNAGPADRGRTEWLARRDLVGAVAVLRHLTLVSRRSGC